MRVVNWAFSSSVSHGIEYKKMQRRRQSHKKNAAKYLGMMVRCHGDDLSWWRAVTVTAKGDKVTKMKLRRRRRKHK